MSALPPLGPGPRYRPTAQEFSQPFDVIVVGGGINGSGIARDAAERGMKVLLIDKSDFGAATSTANSRLIHGGLRYCENLEFGLVRESLREREYLLKNAPHLVKPLPLCIPIYQEARRGYWLIKLGMMLYDLLSFDKTLPRHRMLNRAQFLSEFPGVQEKNLVGGAVYYDAQVNLPERLCLENVLAAKASGAVVMNHAKMEAIIEENQQAAGLQLRDLITGESLMARSRAIVNASGIWVDEVLNTSPTLAAHPAEPKIGGTKGSHIIVKRFPGGPDKALYVEAQKDGRPFFILPWREDYYLIGTTDFPYKGNLDEIVADADEVAYLKAEAARIFPQATLEVLYTYSGVRPLPYAQGTQAGKITRKHIILDHGRHEGMKGLFSIIGGKLTTFRSLAEEAVDHLSRFLGQKGQSQTRKRPLPGGADLRPLETFKAAQIPQALEAYNISPQTASHLIDLYGARYPEVLALTQENPSWKTLLHPSQPDIQAQVIFAVRNEMACSTADVLLRRTGIGLHEGAGLPFATTTARLIGQELGWSEAQIQQDAENYRNTVLQSLHPVKQLQENPPGDPPPIEV